jgi:hypothetical protein
MCPGGQGSGYQHADECILDPLTNTMLCDCPPQFAGKKLITSCLLLKNPTNSTSVVCGVTGHHNHPFDVGD